MRRVFLSCLPVVMYANAVFAADIASNASSAQCVEPTLHRYEGTANLQAQWEANTVPLRWYSNYTMINPTDAIDDCEYSGSLTRPTNPSRTGYTFTGWTVSPKVEFSTLSLGSATAISYGKGEAISNHKDYCWYYDTADHYGYDICNMSEFTELQQYEWKQNFTNGTVYGMAHCSALPGNNYSGTWPAENRANYTSTLDAMNTYDTQHNTEEKKYCWCQATGYKATNQSTIQRPLSSLAWVFGNDRGSASACARSCAAVCADGVRGHSAFRAAVFKAED